MKSCAFGKGVEKENGENYFCFFLSFLILCFIPPPSFFFFVFLCSSFFYFFCVHYPPSLFFILFFFCLVDFLSSPCFRENISLLEHMLTIYTKFLFIKTGFSSRVLFIFFTLLSQKVTIISTNSSDTFPLVLQVQPFLCQVGTEICYIQGGSNMTGTNCD